MIYVLDTCAISEIMKPKPDEGFWSWLENTPHDALRVTMITRAEAAYGVERLPAGKRRDHLFVSLESYLARVPVFGFTHEAAIMTGKILAAQERAGRPMQFADAAIAGIALVNRAALVTRDAHFGGIDAHEALADFRSLNPWSA